VIELWFSHELPLLRVPGDLCVIKRINSSFIETTRKRRKRSLEIRPYKPNRLGKRLTFEQKNDEKGFRE